MEPTKRYLVTFSNGDDAKVIEAVDAGPSSPFFCFYGYRNRLLCSFHEDIVASVADMNYLEMAESQEVG